MLDIIQSIYVTEFKTTESYKSTGSAHLHSTSDTLLFQGSYWTLRISWNSNKNVEWKMYILVTSLRTHTHTQIWTFTWGSFCQEIYVLVWQQGVSAFVEHAQTGQTDCESKDDMLFLRKHNFSIQNRETGQCQVTLDIYDMLLKLLFWCDPKINIILKL